MSEVRSLGYVVVSTGDLDAWEAFATGLLGLQVSERTADRLLLRNDRYWCRLRVELGSAEGVTALGWEVEGPVGLDAISRRLEAAGYEVARHDSAEAGERGVMGLISFTDPDGLGVEVFYGQKADKRRFVSPTGASFVTGEAGLGHVFQLVDDEERFRELYLGILGFKLSDYIEFGPIFGTFTHCNPRHHSYAFAAVPDRPRGIGHLMLEVDDIDIVGRAYDKVLREGAAPLAISFGRHTNDQMMSFYVNSPSGFQIEYGTGGLLIDDATWRPSRYDAPNQWGHEHQRRPVTA
jgi:3,4-dihydroxy-9,10-secoandrosta-1,3,5(10)-triene-9,17-dione 4,5-dioxygenase